MDKLPNQEELSKLLQEVWDTHSEFQHVYLNDVHDEMWAGWYAAFLIGRLGHIAPASQLTNLLEEVGGQENWTVRAAAHLLENLQG